MNAVQIRIDQFLSYANLRSVRDIEYFPRDEVVNIYRKKLGQRNVQLDVSCCSSPSEVLEMIINHSCVY